MAKKLLVVVDMQNDFIDGSLGTPEAQVILPNVIDKVKDWDGDIVYTLDTHFDNYLETQEGKKLPVKHCILGTYGHDLNINLQLALHQRSREGLEVHCVHKNTFGSTVLPELIRFIGYESIELVGLCTDICVISNALLLRANYPDIPITVDAKCCAGVTPQKHEEALDIMLSCQIDIQN